MTLTINLTADAESRLRTAATRQGVKPEVYATKIIEEHLPAINDAKVDQTTLDMLARWDAEDATDNADEIAGRQKDLDDFKHGVNENRLRSDGPASRKIYP